YEKIEGGSERMCCEQLQRVIDGLEIQAFLIGEDGCDDVYELRHIRNLHDIAVIHKCVQKTRNDKRIFEIVVFLKNLSAALGIAAGAIPDVPFVPSDINLLAGRRAPQCVLDYPGRCFNPM